MDNKPSKQVFLSEAQGKIKVEIQKEHETIVALWESVDGDILETLFDDQGAILQQKLSKSTDIGDKITKFLSDVDKSHVKNKDYEEVMLKKQCPNCGNLPLKRVIKDNKGAIPVMPLYLCENCNQKGFHLTSNYLTYLVENNIILFDENDAAKIAQDKQQFIAELQEYVYRIFAAKHINHIK